MFKKYKIKEKIFFSIVILIFIFFIISVPILANNEEVNKITEKKVDCNVNCDTEYLRLLDVVKIKADVANEKEMAYDKAINQLKIYVTLFGSLLILVAIGFGFYKDKKIVEAKDEILKSIEEKKKSLEERNRNNIDKKILDLEKYKLSIEKTQNIDIQDIEKKFKEDINDILSRIKDLERGNKSVNEEDRDTKSSYEFSEDEKYKNENPYD